MFKCQSHLHDHGCEPTVDAAFGSRTNRVGKSLSPSTFKEKTTGQRNVLTNEFEDRLQHWLKMLLVLLAMKKKLTFTLSVCPQLTGSFPGQLNFPTTEFIFMEFGQSITNLIIVFLVLVLICGFHSFRIKEVEVNRLFPHKF